MATPALVTELQQKARHLIHTNYYSNFFLLRTEIIVNGEQAQVGTDERGWLTVNSQSMKVGVTFDSLVTDMNDVLQQHGLHGVSNYWCEEVPLFELNGTSPLELQKLLSLESSICGHLASKLSTRMKDIQQESEVRTAEELRLDVRVEVHSQIYLIIPDYAQKDGRLVQLTKDNFTGCVEVFVASPVFDFGALFRALRANPSREDTGPDNLSILHAELHEVVNWFTFGQALLVPENQLHIINRDNPHNTEMCRSTMLDWWWNNADDHERKWLTIVQALAQTGSRRIAVRIAIKYGVPGPPMKYPLTDTKEAQEDSSSGSDAAKLKAEIDKLRHDIEEKDSELARQYQSLQEAKREREIASRQVETLQHKLSKSQTIVEELRKEKNDTENQLEVKRFEFDALRGAKTHKIELQKLSISQKENEISNLKMHLKFVQDKLLEANTLIPTLEEDIRELSGKLAIKSAKIEVLRESKNDMRELLDLKKRELDSTLIQQVAANTMYYGYKKELEYEEVPEAKILDDEMNDWSQNALQLPRTPTANYPEHYLASTQQRNLSPVGQLTQRASTNMKETRLKWELKTEAPQVLNRGSVAVDSLTQTVYLIGENHNVIHCYRSHSNEWSTLPVACPHTNPGLVFVQNVLTAIGGQVSGRRTTKVSSLKKGKWVNEIPRMKYPHNSPSVLNYDGNYIIVAGGSLDDEISMVELYSIHTRNWFKLIPLPQKFYGITTTLCYNDYVVMDGKGFTYTMDLTLLVSFASNTNPQWRRQPYLPVAGEPTITTFENEVLCISSEGLHQLCEDHGWVKIRRAFPSMSPRSKSIVCVVGGQQGQGGKLVMVGGHNPNHYAPISTEVSVAQYVT